MKFKALTITVAALLVVFASACFCQDAAPQDVKTLINEGVDLYDHHEYEKAVEKYTRALEIDPKNAGALFERSMTYLTMGEYGKCIEGVERGIKLRSELGPDFYTLGGSCYSYQEKLDQALEYFKKGLKKYPDHDQLNFNVAVVYAKMGKSPESRKHLKKVLEVDPDRPSANYFLAGLYEADNYNVAAIFSYLRFFLTEPYSDRTQPAISAMLALVDGTAVKGEGNTINIFWDVSQPKDEGDWSPISLLLSASQALTLGDEAKGRTKAENYVETLRSIILTTEEVDDKKLKKTFVYKHAVQTLINVKNAGVLDVYLYRLLNEVHIEGGGKWLDEHKKEQESLDKWISENISLKGSYFPMQKK